MKVFFDSNILIYANDLSAGEKQKIALRRMTAAIAAEQAAISTQVLAEYTANAIYKLHQPHEQILYQLKLLEKIEIVQLGVPLVRRAMELHRLYQIHFWDAQILAAADHAKCQIMLSEDLNPGQLYAGVRVENPFLKS